MDPGQLVERATALLELGRPVEAEQAAHEAVAADPSSSAALVVLARALTEQRRHDEAVEAARAAVALEPHEWVSHHALGWALLRTKPPRNDEARACAERALELEAGATAAHSVLALALAGLGRTRALTGAAFLSVIGGLVAWFAAQVPRGLRSWAPGVLGRVAVPVRLVVSALVAFGVCVVATAFAPAGLADVAEQAAGLALRLALVLAVVLVVLHLLRRAGRSR